MNISFKMPVFVFKALLKVMYTMSFRNTSYM